MSDNTFRSTRDSNRPKTQVEIEAYVADVPDTLDYHDILSNHLARGKQYPTSSRGRAAAKERAAFAAENPEPVSAEMQAQGDAIIMQYIQTEDVKDYFRAAIKKGTPLESAFAKAFGDRQQCAPMNGFDRDGDPANGNATFINDSITKFADSPMFAAYRAKDKSSPQWSVQQSTISTMWDFMVTNYIALTSVQNWATCFNVLQSIGGILPAPVPTAEQAAERELRIPASDGLPGAVFEGKPVVYQGQRLSQRQLDALDAETYSRVLGLRKVRTDDPRIRAQVGREPQGAPETINGKLVKDMSADEYRIAAGLRRGLNTR